VPQKIVQGSELCNVLKFCTKLQELDLSNIQQVEDSDCVEELAKLSTRRIFLSGCEAFKMPVLNLLQSSSQLEEIKFISLSRHDSVVQLWLDSCMFWCSKLQKLTLSGFVNRDSVAKISRLTNLRSLAFHKTGLRCSNISNIVNMLPSLTHLKISEANLNHHFDSFALCTALRILQLNCVNDESLKLVMEFTNLKELSLKGKREFTEESFTTLSNLNFLERLEINSKIFDFTSLAQQTTKLCELCIMSHRDKGVSKILLLPLLPSLQHLVLAPELRNSVSSDQVWACMPNLKSLKWAYSCNPIIAAKKAEKSSSYNDNEVVDDSVSESDSQ